MEDDRLVQLALSRGYVTPEQVERAKVEQKSLADRGIDHGVYFLLQDLGFLADADARDLRRSVSSSAIRALEVEGFVIQGRLGSGGMGDVFRAGHPDGRKAAVKLLSGKLAKSEEYVRRFLRESRAMQRLSHPNIVGVLGSGESLGTRYILMELVDGPSLKTWLVEKGKLDPGHAAVLLRQMAEALDAAWSHGVLHRDVKPANILLGPPLPGTGEPFQAKLCDFGLARLGPDAGEADLSHGGLTGTGLALGTPHYMSPEQASGEHDVDQRADIYGLGATLYHALLGQTLYSGKSSAVIMYKQVTENVDLDLLRQAGVAAPLVELLGAMLQKRRSARIATWAEVLVRARALAPGGAPAVAAPVRAGPVAPAPVLARAPAAAPSAASVPPAAPAPAPPAPPTPTPSVAPPPAADRAGLGRMVLVTAGTIALLVAVAVGWALSRGQPTAIGPDGLAAALAAVGQGGESARTITLLPGTYPGTLRLGAAHRGLRLRAAGPGVELVGQGLSPAVRCEPGLLDARLEGVLLRGGSSIALETVGACELHLAGVRLDGGLVVGGGSLVARQTQISGRVQVGDRGMFDCAAGRIGGTVTVERADLRLSGSVLNGRLSVRSGSVACDAVRIQAGESPAVSLEHSRCTAVDLLIAAGGIGLEARGCDLAELRGLTITGPGPSLAWEGERQAAWRWERFALDTPPRGLPGVLPAGPGADPARLPP